MSKILKIGSLEAEIANFVKIWLFTQNRQILVIFHYKLLLYRQKIELVAHKAIRNAINLLNIMLIGLNYVYNYIHNLILS